MKSLWTLFKSGIFLGAFLSASTASLHALTEVQIRGFNKSTSGIFRAKPTSEFEWILDSYVPGKTTDGVWFGTFCLEKNERVGNGKIYEVELNDSAVSGGRGGAVNGRDPISVGTAFLYEQFVLGTLSGFNYGNKKNAKQLQNTIWFLEGEISGLNQGYRRAGWGGFLDLAQSLPNYADDYTGARVRVMNLTRNDGRNQHQDQLVYTNVSDGGATALLLAIGLLTLIGIKQRWLRPETAGS